MSRPSFNLQASTTSSTVLQGFNGSAVSLSDSEDSLPSLTSSASSASQSSQEIVKIVASSSEFFRRLSFLYEFSQDQDLDSFKLREDGGPRDLRDLRRLRAAVDALSTEMKKPVERLFSESEVTVSNDERSKFTANGEKCHCNRKIKRKPAPSYTLEDEVTGASTTRKPSFSSARDRGMVKINPTFDISMLTSAVNGSYKLRVDLPLEEIHEKVTSTRTQARAQPQEGTKVTPNRPPKAMRDLDQMNLPSSSIPESKSKDLPSKDRQLPEPATPKKNRMSMMFSRSKASKIKNKDSPPVPPLPISSPMPVTLEMVSSQVPTSQREIKVVTPNTARPTIANDLDDGNAEGKTPRVVTFVSRVDDWSSFNSGDGDGDGAMEKGQNDDGLASITPLVSGINSYNEFDNFGIAIKEERDSHSEDESGNESCFSLFESPTAYDTTPSLSRSISSDSLETTASFASAKASPLVAK